MPMHPAHPRPTARQTTARVTKAATRLPMSVILLFPSPGAWRAFCTKAPSCVPEPQPYHAPWTSTHPNVSEYPASEHTCSHHIKVRGQNET
ncbi:hypothetical protein B0T14DRAFT_247246 [Immersiella caudata]|uniref:Uncharacterized protein n=1 Tax=Immersiella caudata TaxID=314043 RepID=A0AA40BWP3_9PEZI|nr:hypothetical protein B0T14DRAFT_247246 [Immersiella caudata]